MAKIIAHCSHKGGCGKTSSVQNLGAGLAKAGKKVLVVDLDPQGTLTNCMYEPIPEVTIADVVDAALKEERLDPDRVIIRGIEGMDLIPSEQNLAGVEKGLGIVCGSQFILQEYLEELRKDYDYILLDCPPALSDLTVNALVAADSMIIPMTPDIKSIEGAELMLQNTYRQIKKRLNPELVIDGVLLNMVDGNKAKSTRRMIARIRGDYYTFRTEIPKSVREREAAEAKQSIFAFSPKSTVALAYRELTDEILELEQEKSPVKEVMSLE